MLKQHTLCIDEMALPPFCPSHLPTTDTPITAINGTCLCGWTAANGFDGFAATICLASLAYALPLAIAALANVKGPNRRYLSTATINDTGSVVPLPHSGV
jgi:hypothetical protein